jgi:hypothetical protein
MNEHLTESEREAACICAEIANIANVDGVALDDAMIRALCDIHVDALAARLAGVRDLADEWMRKAMARETLGRGDAMTTYDLAAIALRAALDSPVGTTGGDACQP